jgi:hypothetical protein
MLFDRRTHDPLQLTNSVVRRVHRVVGPEDNAVGEAMAND